MILPLPATASLPPPPRVILKEVSSHRVLQVPQRTPVFTSALLRKSGFEGLVQGNLVQVHLPLGGPLSQCLQQGLLTTHQGRCLRSRCFSHKIHVSTGGGSAARGWPPFALPSPRCPAHLISSHSCGPGMARCSTS